jgi:hypothetical protein
MDEVHRLAPASVAKPGQIVRPIAAAIDLYALVRSLPADGQMSTEDSQILADWAARYQDAPLPSREYLWDIIANALARRMIAAEDRAWLYFAVDPALPRQLRRVVQRQRLIAEVREARLNGRTCDSVSFDFLLVGGHLSGYRERIQTRLTVGTAVRFLQDTESASGRIRVELSSGEVVGFVPLDDTPSIAQELSVSGTAEGVVRKVLSDGLFPIPVIGTRVPYVVEPVDVPVSIEAWREPNHDSLNTAPPPTPSKSPLSALTRALSAKLKPVTSLFRER